MTGARLLDGTRKYTRAGFMLTCNNADIGS